MLARNRLSRDLAGENKILKQRINTCHETMHHLKVIHRRELDRMETENYETVKTMTLHQLELCKVIDVLTREVQKHLSVTEYVNLINSINSILAEAERQGNA